MVWLGVTLGVGAIALLIAIAVQVRRRSGAGRSMDDVDPLFTTGVAVTGAGAVLATTLGGVMYGVMAAGLIVMAIGVNRSRHPHH